MASDERGWLSAHIFFDGWVYTGECDRVAIDVAEPFVRRCEEEGWIDAHFFIRYSDVGPHVRLRLHGDRPVLENKVWPALREAVAALYPDVKDGLPTGIEPGHGATGRVTHLARVEYEPETERYGGPEGVLLAEDFFEVSSELAYALLRRTDPAQRSSRLGKGVLASVVLVHAFCRDQQAAAEFASRYGTNYLRSLVPDEGARSTWVDAFTSGFEQQADNLLPYVEEMWDRLENDESLSEALDPFRDGVGEVRDQFMKLWREGLLTRGPHPLPEWEQAVSAIVSSYLHMNNNRLGITIQEEAYLAFILARALGHVAPQPGASGAA